MDCRRGAGFAIAGEQSDPYSKSMPNGAVGETSQPSGTGDPVRGVLRAIVVTLLATVVQGLVALNFDVGILYPVMGYLIGSTVRIRSAVLPVRRRQAVAFLLTYIAVALSPLIPYGRAVGFDPIRMRNTAFGLVLAFVPMMAKTGLVGIINIGLALFGVHQAWVQSGKPLPTNQPS